MVRPAPPRACAAGALCARGNAGAQGGHTHRLIGAARLAPCRAPCAPSPACPAPLEWRLLSRSSCCRRPARPWARTMWRSTRSRRQPACLYAATRRARGAAAEAAAATAAAPEPAANASPADLHGALCNQPLVMIARGVTTWMHVTALCWREACAARGHHVAAVSYKSLVACAQPHAPGRRPSARRQRAEACSCTRVRGTLCARLGNGPVPELRRACVGACGGEEEVGSKGGR